MSRRPTFLSDRERVLFLHILTSRSATFRELRSLLPELPAQTVMTAIHALVRERFIVVNLADRGGEMIDIVYVPMAA